MWPLTVMVPWAAKLSGSNPAVVVSEHNQIGSTPVFERFGNRRVIPFTMKLSYPKTDAVVGASKGVLQHLKELSGSYLPHGVTIYNPAAPSDEQIRSSEDLSDEIFRKKCKRIIAIGTLKEQKDYPTLLRAFKKVTVKKNAELLILGEGPERPKLEKLINELNLQGNVHLPGFVQNPISYLKGADLFVLSSAWEGFGNVIVEALACGVPVVSTDCKSGPAEILENGKYGSLVPVGEPQALAETILEELDKEHDPEPLKTRAQDFSAEKIVGQYLELLFPERV
jgi:glycosyltransferase involved in cell wall biosynthesis